MPKINFNEAKEWLENVKPEDNVAVIHHDDGDGFVSGILFYDWCKQKGAKVEEFTYELSKSSFKDYPLEKFNKVIITDLTPHVIFDDLILVEDKDVFYTDHHDGTAIPESILELRTTDQGYIPSSRTAGELTRIKEWLCVAGTVCDAGEKYVENQEFINSFLEKEKMSIEEFKNKITSKITNSISYFKEKPQEAFKIFQKMESLDDIKSIYSYAEIIENEIEEIINQYAEKREKLGDINFYYFEPKHSITKPVAQTISLGEMGMRKDDGQAFILASPDKTGEYIRISSRDQSDKRDMNLVMKAGVKNLQDSSGGGHKRAAGGMIRKEDLEKFKQQVRDFINK